MLFALTADNWRGRWGAASPIASPVPVSARIHRRRICPRLPTAPRKAASGRAGYSRLSPRTVESRSGTRPQRPPPPQMCRPRIMRRNAGILQLSGGLIRTGVGGLSKPGSRCSRASGSEAGSPPPPMSGPPYNATALAGGGGSLGGLGGAAGGGAAKKSPPR